MEWIIITFVLDVIIASGIGVAAAREIKRSIKQFVTYSALAPILLFVLSASAFVVQEKYTNIDLVVEFLIRQFTLLITGTVISTIPLAIFSAFADPIKSLIKEILKIY